MTTRERKPFDLYVDDNYVGTKQTSWSPRRIMAWLSRKHPCAKSLEVRLREEESSVHILRA